MVSDTVCVWNTILELMSTGNKISNWVGSQDPPWRGHPDMQQELLLQI